MRPSLLTFDVFGTLVDWRSGLGTALAAHGHELTDKEFERILAAQEVDEAGPFRKYGAIVAASLQRALGLAKAEAELIGRDVGQWPLFPDAADALRQLLAVTPCVAMTNSDRAHGKQVQEQLGFPLTDWVCAEEIRVYKPRAEFWKKVSDRLGVAPGKEWWHVSAYADYDLEPARDFGLTTVFVGRAHARPGRANKRVKDLARLAQRIAAGK